MGVTVCLPLFGEPGRELDQGSPVTGRRLRELAASLNERLEKAAATLDMLAAAGWTAQVALFDAVLYHPQVATREDAERLLRAAGADPEGMIIVEDVEDEEEGDQSF
jgi:hypothetical protein